MYIYMGGMCMCVHASVYMLLEVRGQPQLLPSETPYGHLFRYRVTKLAGESQGSLRLHLPSTGHSDVGVVDQTWVLMLSRQAC